MAGWYTGSPRPGAIGAAVIAGHIDSLTGPGIFFRLRLLHPGNRVYVRRADGSVAVFKVTSLHLYPKARFPAAAVYGPGARRPAAPDHLWRYLRPGDRSLPERCHRLCAASPLTAQREPWIAITAVPARCDDPSRPSPLFRDDRRATAAAAAEAWQAA